MWIIILRRTKTLVIFIPVILVYPKIKFLPWQQINDLFEIWLTDFFYFLLYLYTVSSEIITINDFIMKFTRRNFLMHSAIGVAGIPMILSATLPEYSSSGKPKKSEKPPFKQNDVILFQGDSITDAGRNKNTQNANDAGSFGGGYALMTAASLLCNYPELSLEIYNRGISGNKVYQLIDRWNADCIDLKPSVLSILIGVNDYWHKRNNQYDGTISVYEYDFRALLKSTIEALPDCKLVICEPFAVDGGTAIGEGWQKDFELYRMVARKLSEEFKTPFIPFHSIFREALNYAPAAYWCPDGVHPSMAGAQLMAKAWQNVVCKVR